MPGIDMQFFVAIALFALAAKLSKWNLAARATIAVLIPYLYSVLVSYIFASQSNPSLWELLTVPDLVVVIVQFTLAMFIFYKLNQTEDSSLVAWMAIWILGAFSIYLLIPTIL